MTRQTPRPSLSAWRTPAWTAGSLAIASLIAATPPAFAQPNAAPDRASPNTTPDHAPSAQDEARAEELFRRGSEAFDRGQLEEACGSFAESMRAYATLGTLLNLALCHEKQGRVATAWAEFNQACAWASEPSQKDRRDFAHQHVARLERALPRLRVTWDATSPPATLWLDGEPLGLSRAATPLFVDPGPHVVRAFTPGHAAVTREVSASADGQPVVVTIPPLEAETAPPAPPRERRSSASEERTRLGVATTGAGVLLLGVGLGVGVEALSQTGKLSGACASGCSAGRAEAFEAVSITSFALGAAALGAGVWLFATGTRDGGEHVREAHAPPPKAAVVPTASTHGGGLAVAGTF